MTPTPSLRRSASRVLLGLLLAFGVYLALEALGFGNSRRQRDITFSLGARSAAFLSVIYSQSDIFIRRADLPVQGGSVIDHTELPAGRYELDVELSFGSETTSLSRTIDLGEEESLRVDLSSP